jgi:hypothetical protein
LCRNTPVVPATMPEPIPVKFDWIIETAMPWASTAQK